MPNFSFRKLSSLALALLIPMTATACAKTIRPGDVSQLEKPALAPREGNVVLLRGWIGIFSAGIDELGERINKAGIFANVYQEAQWRQIAEQLERRYSASPYYHEPLVLIGHSYGADSALRIANQLNARNIPVDLLITLDPVTPPTVPPNVRRTYNLYQSNGVFDQFPWLRGIPLTPDPANHNPIQNMDIRRDRKDLLVSNLDHFNIEKQPQIHVDILKQLWGVCPPRTASRPIPMAKMPAGAPASKGREPATKPTSPTQGRSQ